MLQHFEDILIFILSLPLIFYQLLRHLVERIMMLNSKTSDYLFMKRFKLIDSKHVDDFLEWNNKYIENRNR